jgi:hypothetical protein
MTLVFPVLLSQFMKNSLICLLNFFLAMWIFKGNGEF